MSDEGLLPQPEGIDDLAYYWRCFASAQAATAADNAALIAAVPGLVEAAEAVIKRMTSTFKARSGRDVGIEADDGEKCWIVHSDEITALEAALASIGRKP